MPWRINSIRIHATVSDLYFTRSFTFLDNLKMLICFSLHYMQLESVDVFLRYIIVNISLIYEVPLFSACFNSAASATFSSGFAKSPC